MPLTVLSAQDVQKAESRRRSDQNESYIYCTILAILLFLTIFPFYFGTGQFQLSVQYIFIAIWALCFWRTIARSFPLVFTAIAIAYLIGVFNDEDLVTPVKELFAIVVFITAYATSCSALIENPTRAIALLRKFMFFAAICGITVFVFRLYPAIEESYYRSDVIFPFINPSFVTFDSKLDFNSLDVDKAGGILYANGNQAAGFFFGMACLSMVVLRRRPYKYVAALYFLIIAIVTGSKTPVFFLPILCVLTAIHATDKLKVATQLKIAIIIFFSLGVAILIYCSNLAVIVGEVDTFQIRIGLWARALQVLPEYYMFGARDGYWRDIFFSGSKLYYTYLPVHNFTLSFLLSFGIFPLFILYTAVFIMAKKIFVSSRHNGRAFYVLVFFSYVAIYSQIENTTVFGDFRSAVLLGAAISITETIYRKRNLDELSSVGPMEDRPSRNRLSVGAAYHA